MINRVDKRLVFKPLNNRRYLHSETEPCINGRILGIGAYFKEPLSESCVGTATERGSCDLGVLAMAWVRKLGAT